MRDLLPADVAVAVAGPDDWTGTLLPTERACLSERAVESRRQEYTAGRVCARRALATLGIPPAAIPSADDRSPVWPAGVVGSITHTAGYCAAVVARSDAVRSVGIDAEQHRELDRGVQRLVCHPAELDWLARQPAGVHWPAVIFSAKETVYKVWHPVAGSWLGFLDARLEIDPRAGVFVAHLAAEPVQAATRQGRHVPQTVTGRFTVDGGLVRTAAVLTVAD